MLACPRSWMRFAILSTSTFAKARMQEMVGRMLWWMMLFGGLFVVWRIGLSLGCLFVGARSTSTRFRSGGFALDSRDWSFDLSFQGRFKA